MHNPYDPGTEEIRAWAYAPGSLEPVQDWDLHLAHARHEKVYLELASDASCPARDYFLRILYLIVGNAVRTRFKSEPEYLISGFLERAQGYPDDAVQMWIVRSRELIRHPETFDYAQWCAGGFVRSDVERNVTRGAANSRTPGSTDRK